MIFLSILATFVGFFWYFSTYLKKKTSTNSSPQTGNKDTSDSNIALNNLNEKVQALIDRDLVIHVNSFSLIPELDPQDERIIVVAVDETNGNSKCTYLYDKNGLTLISKQSEESFAFVTAVDGILNI